MVSFRRKLRLFLLVFRGGGGGLTFLRGKVVRSLNSSNGYPLEATKSKSTCSSQLPRKRRSRNSPLGVRILSLLTCFPEFSLGSGGSACSSDRRMACETKGGEFSSPQGNDQQSKHSAEYLKKKDLLCGFSTISPKAKPNLCILNLCSFHSCPLKPPTPPSLLLVWPAGEHMP